MFFVLIQKPLKICGFYFFLLPWMLHKNCCYMLNVLLLLLVLFADSVDKCSNTLPSAYIYVCVCECVGIYILYTRLSNVLQMYQSNGTGVPKC